APLARISADPDQREAYVYMVGAVVLSAWHPTPHSEKIAGAAVAGVMKDLKQIKTHAAGMRDTISAATIQFVKECYDEDLLSVHKEQIAELICLVEHLLAAAEPKRRPRGGQSRSVMGKSRATEYERFVGRLLRAILEVGGKLTVDKNDNDEG